MKQGRCWHCEVRWTWKRNLTPDEAACPNCGRLLRKTTHCCEDEMRQAEAVTTASGLHILRALPSDKAAL